MSWAIKSFKRFFTKAQYCTSLDFVHPCMSLSSICSFSFHFAVSGRENVWFHAKIGSPVHSLALIRPHKRQPVLVTVVELGNKNIQLIPYPSFIHDYSNMPLWTMLWQRVERALRHNYKYFLQVIRRAPGLEILSFSFSRMLFKAGCINGQAQ